ncbi:hypothetical protein ILUMI_09118 [Ignelater luminosus]|uniref:Uncharacterized protein n=1 Tax=Ignelater luminosus TaxID=2038154 RepID=A0A8K0GGB8_IGNLU|nr:hypothetical protein ILUMI_09118 [Ignelater luminosus]
MKIQKQKRKNKRRDQNRPEIRQKLIDPNKLDAERKERLTRQLRTASEDINYNLPIEDVRSDCKKAFIECYKQVSHENGANSDWISNESWSRINQRRKIKNKILCATNDQVKEKLQKDIQLVAAQ